MMSRGRGAHWIGREGTGVHDRSSRSVESRQMSNSFRGVSRVSCLVPQDSGQRSMEFEFQTRSCARVVNSAETLGKGRGRHRRGRRCVGGGSVEKRESVSYGSESHDDTASSTHLVAMDADILPVRSR